jgi:guanosine-3',5'-bis(diphosphate) 3'-pyrophosphohydrolase
MNNAIAFAREFAVRCHGEQLYGDRPFVYHLDQVAENAKKHGGDTDNIISCYLHDVLEDTNVTYHTVQDLFGSRIAGVVDLVTNRGSKELTFNRIRRNADAVFVKLCDRLANVSNLDKNKMYKKHHKVFREILWREGEYSDLWEQIDTILERSV